MDWHLLEPFFVAKGMNLDPLPGCSRRYGSDISSTNEPQKCWKYVMVILAVASHLFVPAKIRIPSLTSITLPIIYYFLPPPPLPHSPHTFTPSSGSLLSQMPVKSTNCWSIDHSTQKGGFLGQWWCVWNALHRDGEDTDERPYNVLGHWMQHACL